jgi:hypothetical protein
MHGGHAAVIFSKVRKIAVISWKEEDRKVSSDS